MALIKAFDGEVFYYSARLPIVAVAGGSDGWVDDQ